MPIKKSTGDKYRQGTRIVWPYSCGLFEEGTGLVWFCFVLHAQKWADMQGSKEESSSLECLQGEQAPSWDREHGRSLVIKGNGTEQG